MYLCAKFGCSTSDLVEVRRQTGRQKDFVYFIKIWTGLLLSFLCKITRLK